MNDFYYRKVDAYKLAKELTKYVYLLFDEYQKHIEKDAALKRRFQEVIVNEPDYDTTRQIIE